MKFKLIKSQISNLKTYEMKRRQLCNLAQNVFVFKNMPLSVDKNYLNQNLLYKGQIAFFVDEVLGLLALPFNVIGTLDVYNRPQKIQVIGQNGYTRILNKNEFVIMYDNNARYPLFLDIKQYAERIANAMRVIDVNLEQQKCPRIFKCPEGMEKSLNDLLNTVDGNVEKIITNESLALDELEVILSPAPYVADKVDIQAERIKNEFLSLIGVANVSYQKRERNIKDEINAQQGGTIANRFSRFDARQTALDEINMKFKNVLLADGSVTFSEDITCEYYDGLPSSKEELIDIENESEVAENV